jgi:hypothetical protein
MSSTQILGLLRQKVCARAGKDLDLTRKVHDYFRKYDSNGDGQLSKKELNRSIQDMCQVYLKDQQLSELFDVIDTNGDGILDRKEILGTFLGRKNELEKNNFAAAWPACDPSAHALESINRMPKGRVLKQPIFNGERKNSQFLVKPSAQTNSKSAADILKVGNFRRVVRRVSQLSRSVQCIVYNVFIAFYCHHVIAFYCHHVKDYSFKN